MSFSVWLQWFHEGEPAPVAVAALREAFGALASEVDGRLRVAGAELEGVEPDALSTAAIELRRPSSAPEFWSAVHACIALPGGVAYWPESPPLVASSGASEHLPPDLLEVLGAAREVRDGAELHQLLRSI